MNPLRRFSRFLYDFLVGDAWELFVGPLVALLGAWLLVRMGVDPTLVGGLLVAGLVVVVIVNLRLSLRGAG